MGTICAERAALRCAGPNRVTDCLENGRQIPVDDSDGAGDVRTGGAGNAGEVDLATAHQQQSPARHAGESIASWEPVVNSPVVGRGPGALCMNPVDHPRVRVARPLPSSTCQWRFSRTDSSILRSWVTSSRVPVYASSACSSCSMAGRSRWLVGSSRTSRLTPLACNNASAALVRSPGESEIARPQHVLGLQAELREQGTNVGFRPVRAPDRRRSAEPWPAPAVGRAPGRPHRRPPRNPTTLSPLSVPAGRATARAVSTSRRRSDR